MQIRRFLPRVNCLETRLTPALVVYEPFDYAANSNPRLQVASDGSDIGFGTNRWTDSSGNSTGSFGYISPGLDYPAGFIPGSDPVISQVGNAYGRVQLGGGQFADQRMFASGTTIGDTSAASGLGGGTNGKTWYISALIQPNSVDRAVNNAVAQGFGGVRLGRDVVATENDGFLGFGGGSTSPSNRGYSFNGFSGPGTGGISTIEPVVGQPVLLVGKATFSGDAGVDTFELFVNPGSTEPLTPNAVHNDTDYGDWDRILIQGNYGFFLDEIKIGTSFADVVTFQPQDVGTLTPMGAPFGITGTVIPTTKDSYIQNNSSTAQDRNTFLDVQTTANTIVEFDQAAITAALSGGTLQKATLVAFSGRFGIPNGTTELLSNLQVYRVTTPWVESQVTGLNPSTGVSWNTNGDGTNSPGDFVGTTGVKNANPYAVADSTDDRVDTFDVTSLVQEWIGGTPNYGLVIRTTALRNLYLASELPNSDTTISLVIQASASAAVPSVSSLAPSSGTVTGGQQVTITGTGFTGVTAVSFGGVAASFTLVNDTTITATVPAGSGLVDVAVTTPGGTSSTVGSADDFTYVAALTAIKLDGVDVTAPVQQRSTVRSLTLDFNAPVTALTTFAAAITVTDDGGVAIPGLSLAITSTGNSLTIAFTDANVGDETGPVRFNSLADGRYRLSVNGSQLTHGGVAIDADGNGTAGGIRTYDFHRLFGDTDGDASVGLADLTGLQAAFGEENGALDFDNDGTVGLSDLLKVQENLGNSL